MKKDATKKLNEYKADYKAVTPPLSATEAWDELSALLPRQIDKEAHIPLYRFAFLPVLAFLIICGMYFTNTAKPGDTLFPVRVAGYQVFSRVPLIQTIIPAIPTPTITTKPSPTMIPVPTASSRKDNEGDHVASPSGILRKNDTDEERNQMNEGKKKLEEDTKEIETITPRITVPPEVHSVLGTETQEKNSHSEGNNNGKNNGEKNSQETNIIKEESDNNSHRGK